MHFPVTDMFDVGGQLRLESSCIWVNKVILWSSHFTSLCISHLGHLSPSSKVVAVDTNLQHLEPYIVFICSVLYSE